MTTIKMTVKQLYDLLSDAYDVGWIDYESVYDPLNKNEWKDATMKMKRDKFIEEIKKLREFK